MGLDTEVGIVRKGWTNKERFEDFIEGAVDGNKFAVDCCIDEEHSERIPVCANMFSMPHPDEDIYLAHDMPEIDFEKEFYFLKKLESLRDTKLSEMHNLPTKYTRLSWFLRDRKVDNYCDAHDYKSDLSILRGDIPERKQVKHGKKLIETGRDLAAYVHSDDPFLEWFNVIDQLLDMGIEVNQPEEHRFSQWITLRAMVGTCVWRSHLLSFRYKLATANPRPETWAHQNRKDFTTCYAEGSPMHFSTPAMHMGAAETINSAMHEMVNVQRTLPNGRTVGQEMTQMTSNIKHGREFGVHWPSDNSEAAARPYRKLGKRIAAEFGGSGLETHLAKPYHKLGERIGSFSEGEKCLIALR